MGGPSIESISARTLCAPLNDQSTVVQMAKERKVGLSLGRFQPFHNGHLQAVKSILAEVDEVVIVVGSAQLSHMEMNPFSAGERLTMIRLALNEAHVDPKRYLTVTVPIDESHSVYVAKITAYTPEFNDVYSNDPLIRLLFEESGVPAKAIATYRRDIYSGAEFRRRVLVGEHWEELVHSSVAEYLDKIKGIDRVRRIFRNLDFQRFGEQNTL